MSRALLVAAVLLVAGCSTDDAVSTVTAPASPLTSPETAPTAPDTTPMTSPDTTPTTSGVQPIGFDAVAGEVTAPDGEVCAVCVWVAATPEQRSRGLMGVTDMGGADGMVFRFEVESTSPFWMRDTPMPLSIAFFDASGLFVSSTDMAPCLDTAPENCPRYPAGGPYTSAIEVPQGGLDALLIGPGSRLAMLDAPCDPGA